MTKHKIVYVDEESKEIRVFQRKFSNDFEVIGLLPKKELDVLIEAIFDSGANAVVTDFKLAEYRTDVKYPVPYDGANLVQAIREIRQGFPCFILTSFDGDAIKESEDVNLIYPKDALDQQIGNTTLQEKVRVQIEHYNALIKQSSVDFHLLTEKAARGSLTEKDEARLVELDSLLERAYNAKGAVPKAAKQAAGIEKLGELLKSTDELIQELRKVKNK